MFQPLRDTAVGHIPPNTPLGLPDHLELLDYKTDRRKSEADFLAAYRAQLDLYALAISKRFAPKPVTYKGIYSLELGKLIEVR